MPSSLVQPVINLSCELFLHGQRHLIPTRKVLQAPLFLCSWSKLIAGSTEECFGCFFGLFSVLFSVVDSSFTQLIVFSYRILMHSPRINFLKDKVWRFSPFS